VKQPGLTEKFQLAREWFQWAKAVYFLGFGYGTINVQRLGYECFERPKVMGTAFNLSYDPLSYVETVSGQRLYRQLRNIQQQKVYDFIHRFVAWGELDLPDGLPSYTL
jgi:hypothetical protein